MLGYVVSTAGSRNRLECGTLDIADSLRMKQRSTVAVRDGHLALDTRQLEDLLRFLNIFVLHKC